MTLSVTWGPANSRRLARQWLADEPAKGSSPSELAEVVSAMLGAHAQVLSAAELSVGMRVADGTRQSVRDALWEAGALVKTYGPRGTVHLLPASELPFWCGALSALPAGRQQHSDGVRLSPGQTEDVVAAIGEALQGVCLTADELTEEVVARTGPWAGELTMPAFQGFWPRWRTVTHLAAHRGVLCFGPDRGRKATYTRPGGAGGVVPLPADEAVAALVRRYLYAYGPATPASFAKWLAAPVGWASQAFAALGDGIERVDFDGVEAWVVAGDVEFPDTPGAPGAPGVLARGVRLLPYFDAFGIAGYPRERLFAGPAYTRALARGQAGNSPVVLVDGEVGGVWHLKRAGRRCVVTVEALGRLSAAQVRELEGQVARVGEVVEARGELVLGPVTVGAHA
ncbi:winged helix DNA-binding domain-containing protein [Streptomyces sp. NBC_01304]|uniref:winged helix DNA-binding domain-containing protein n=1 Tax=Streptomyces sp. NBC_01304 TaxID=2903818 RepID=UPI002E1201E2|nr:winged helix DNA-binding domain-containing protein [Streptomyces sp. NBC_01304]